MHKTFDDGNLMFKRNTRYFLLCFCAVSLNGFRPAIAGDIQTMALPALPLARSPIIVDGNFSDWPDTAVVDFKPVDTGLTASSSASLAKLRKLRPEASVRACYDAKALYIGIDWHCAREGQSGASISLHVQTDEVVHIQVAPVSNGRQAVTEQIGSSGKSVDIAASGVACVSRLGDDNSATQEIRLPWSILCASGKEPVCALRFGFDFKWPALTSPLLSKLPNDVLRRSFYQTFCFLTSADKEYCNAPVLLKSEEWGKLTFTDSPEPNRTGSRDSGAGATEMFATRETTPIRINGDLSDWNLSQFQTAADMPALFGDRYSCKIGTAFDDVYLFVAMIANSPGGPRNFKTESTQEGFGGGDALQIRLGNGRSTISLCGWFDTSSRKPALTADAHDLPNPFILTLGAKEAFRQLPDGTGYVQEIAIPWSVLNGGTCPKAGDSWAATFQPWWSSVGTPFSAVAATSLEPGGGIPIPYSLPVESNVTIGIYDSAGRLIQTPLKDAHRRAGKNVEYWDGKDQFGAVVSPGAYQARGIYHPPIDTQYLFSIDNPGSPPWPTPDGKGDWLSDEAAPQSVVTDGADVFLAAPGSEKGYSIICVREDGKRAWGYQAPVNPRCVSLTLDGQYLYALFAGPELTDSSNRFYGMNAVGRAFLICLDKTTGSPALFSLRKANLKITTWPYVDHTAGLWDLRTSQTLTPAAYEGQTRYFTDDVGEVTEAVGIAATGGRLYVSMYDQDRLLEFDPATGKQLGSVPLPKPVGLHALADGTILAVSAGTVVDLDPRAGTVTTLIANNLDAPHDVTTDEAGNLFVSDWGKSFQVKMFSPGGALIRAIGAPGGRCWVGAWKPDGMLLPRGIAVTKSGELWVAEDDAMPSRVSVWNPATGALIRDYVGPAAYGGGANFWVDPSDMRTVLAGGVLFRVDYAAKKATPISTPFRRMSEDEPFTPGAGYGPHPGSRTIVHAGVQYVYAAKSDNSMTIFRRDGGRLIPVGAIGCLGRLVTTDGTQGEIWDSDMGVHRIQGFYPAFFRGHAGDNYVWTDIDGDGEVEPNEMQWLPTLSRGDACTAGRQPEISTGWNFGIGPDGAVYYAGFCRDATALYRLDLEGWSASGAPEYDLAKAKLISSGPVHIEGLYVDDENQILVSRPYEWTPEKTTIDAYDRDGGFLWSIASPKGAQLPTDILSDAVLGEYSVKGVGAILASWLWHANYKPYLITADGMYVSSLLEDTRIGPLADWDESYRQFFQGSDGTPYMVNGGNDSYHFLKIRGLDQMHRFAASITVSAADIAAATSQKRRDGATAVAPPIIHVAYLAVAPKIDGDLSGWPMNSDFVSLKGDHEKSARVSIARDAGNLYLAYDVRGSKLVNKGGNWQTMFISGDCVDLMLSSGHDADHYTPAEGDERLLISLYQGQPIAVRYRPVVPSAKSPVRLMAATIDEIARIDSAHIAYKRDNGGYTLEASIPLAELGIDPLKSDVVRGDVGVIYADETGANRCERMYYFNHRTSITADLSTEATLQPGEWGEIELPLGINLLKNPGFEEPFAVRGDDGWTTGPGRCAKAAISPDASFSGSQSLLLEQTAPVAFPPESYAARDQRARASNSE